MDTKSQVLNILKSKIGETVSGTEMADGLGVSRNAVCKAVTALKKEGWNILAATNKGYRLMPTDFLDKAEIALLADLSQEKIYIYDTVGSTNSLAVKMASEGCAEGSLIIAEAQTSGRGRKGREFFSPKGTGVYMSLVLRPQFSAQQALFVTTAASVAAARAIESVVGCKCSVKWVNDVYCREKKVCGILTEAAMDLESGGLAYCVVGIGINVYNPLEGFPENLRNIAAGVATGFPTTNLRNRIIAAFMREFMAFYNAGMTKNLIDEYKERSNVLGKSITVYRGNEKFSATAVDITDDAALVVRRSDGSTELLSSGEITIRREETGE